MDQRLKTNILLKFFFYIQNIFENFNHFFKAGSLKTLLNIKDKSSNTDVLEYKTFLLFLGQTSFLKNDRKFVVTKKKKILHQIIILFY